MVSGSLLLVGSLAAHGPAWAQTRSVFINGQHISDAQLAALEQRACAPIPEGRYWLDMRTGHWGYAGSSRVQGVLGEACVRAPAAS